MPLLPLDTFRDLLGYHPWHFWGFAHNTLAPVTSKCQGLLREYPWQDADRISRFDVRRALGRADEKLREQLGYSVAPRYAEQTLSFPRPAERSFQYAGSAGSDGRWLSIQLQEGQLQAIGIETLTLIDDAVIVTFSDPDGDGLNERFTLTATVTAGLSPSEVAVYFAAADRLNGEAAGERWRVEPVKVSITGTTATITGPGWVLAKPIKYEGRTNIGQGLDPTVATNFVTTLDVYRRYTSSAGTTAETAQGVLTWETLPADGLGSCCGSSTDSSTDPAAIAQAIARVGIRNARQGWVMPGQAAYNSTSGTWYTVNWSSCRQPDRATIRYYAGLALVDQQMDPQWRDVVAHLAAAELPRPGQGCDTANHWLSYWQFDLARSSGANDETYGLSAEAINNPFGSRRGQVEAWRRVIAKYAGRGSTLG